MGCCLISARQAIFFCRIRVHLASFIASLGVMSRASTVPGHGETSRSPLLVTALLLFFFFGLHNLLQEAIMSFEGFKFGLMLGYLEVLGVTVFTCAERRWWGTDSVCASTSGGSSSNNSSSGSSIIRTRSTAHSSTRSNPDSRQPSKRSQPTLKAYLFLTFLLMSSSSLSNVSLNYINYPTKVVFRR